MADPSRPPTFKDYGAGQDCHTCGRHLTSRDPAWFQGLPTRAVYCNAQCYAARFQEAETHR